MQNAQINTTPAQLHNAMAQIILNGVGDDETLRISQSKDGIEIWHDHNKIYEEGTGRVTQRKIIREMDADELEDYARRLRTKIDEGGVIEKEFKEYLECRQVYKQLTTQDLDEVISIK